MTLLITNKEGLYADMRTVTEVSGYQTPGVKDKIIVSPISNIAMATTGAQQHGKKLVRPLMDILAVMSYLNWFCNDWGYANASGYLLDLYDNLANVFEKNIGGIMSTMDCHALVAITTHHNIHAKRNSIDISPPIGVYTEGSSNVLSAILLQGGKTVPEVFDICSKADDYISRGTFTHHKRSDLVCRPFPGLLTAIIKNTAFSEEITLQELRDVYTAETILISHLVLKDKNKRPLQDKHYKKIWDIASANQAAVSSLTKPEILKALNELHNSQ